MVFLALSFVLANVFLSYFVGTHALRSWMTEPPAKHLAGFLVVAVTTGLVFFDFAYFREQMCTVICPYARLQSVLLDRSSLVDRLRRQARRTAQQGQAEAGQRRLHRLPGVRRRLSDRASTFAKACSSSASPALNASMPATRSWRASTSRAG